MKLMAVYRLLHWQISSKGEGNDNRATPFVIEKLAHKVEGTMIPSDRKKQTRNHLDCGSVFLPSGRPGWAPLTGNPYAIATDHWIFIDRALHSALCCITIL